MFISLPDPDPNFIKILESEFHNFIWGSNGHKIKKSIVIQNHDRGGLKITELNFIISLKKIFL